LSKTLGGPSIRELVLRMMPKDPRWKVLWHIRFSRQLNHMKEPLTMLKLRSKGRR